MSSLSLHGTPRRPRTAESTPAARARHPGLTLASGRRKARALVLAVAGSMGGLFGVFSLFGLSGASRAASPEPPPPPPGKAVAAAAPAPDLSVPVLNRLKSTGELPVCVWPDYYGITFRNPYTGQLSGIDVDLSEAFAKDLGVKLRYVESSFATLIDDVTKGRCDIAMFAIGVTPQRRERLAFSTAYLQSDIYGITTRSSRLVKSWDDIDQPGVAVAVQAGTFMEPVMTARLKQARLVVIRPPKTREAELAAGRIDVFMTDYPYSRRLLENADWMRLIPPPKPFHVIPYAYAVRPGDEPWLARINAFVAAIKADGRLTAAARRHGLTDIVAR
ncbi:amino acid ABC transporter substrate-binding protein (PAAT family) [Roseateles depolymerans]|uniref:Periplasmic component of amino acid ABC-type transporter/signal transduction system n=1 Tax=Roseateles depolymerans TaxID=76731 RepID=A0A0U3MF11_9BURK|nr:Periplasmic component of amino acid ABC-type transporter/signal transduction system [Roseateles depolymerans]REG19917.1 amino acid ABC transporter substrate-binding protein (PAAT family) [Roseateles depolymerans]